MGTAAKKIEGFVNMVRVFRASVPEYGMRGLIADIIDKTGYVEELKESEEDDAGERIENIYELVNKIVYYEDNAEEPSLSGFLEEVALVSDIDNLEGGTDRAVLMTLHAAKGLEFDRVYIAGCEDGIFPSYMSVMDTDMDAIEEERRLAYVGITRAKQDLTITYSRTRMNRGEMQHNPVSRFIREIPQELFDNSLPKKRSADIDLYDDDSYERSVFHSKPFGTRMDTVYQKKQEKPRETASKVSLLSINKGMTKAESLDYKSGDRVSHIKYGTGTVVDIEEDVKDYKVTVEFDTAGRKIMYAMFAKLKKV